MSVRATESIEILLVDDDEDDVLMMREALRAAKSSARLRVLSEGSQVTPYLRGEGDHAGANRPDLILLDLNLPGRDGRQVLADIKGGRRGANRRRCDRRGGGSPGRGGRANASRRSSVPLERVGALHRVMPSPFGPAGDGYHQSVTDSPQPPGDDAIASGIGASEAQWVSVAQAARATGTSEAWIMDRCRDGRLPHRAAGAPESSGTDRMVPLATVRALVDGRISE